MGIKFLKFQSIQGENSDYEETIRATISFMNLTFSRSIENKYGIERELKLASMKIYTVLRLK